MSQVNYTDLLIESILEESAKTDFRDKFGEDTLKKFDAAKQRFLNNKLSTDYGQYLKYSKEDLLQLIADQYDKEKDATKIRNIKGDCTIDPTVRSELIQKLFNSLKESGTVCTIEDIDFRIIKEN